jgi:hypothetical protein
MKPLKYLTLTFFIASTSACANNVIAETDKNHLLYGTWNCKATLEGDGGKVSLDIDTTYVRNGKLNSFGTLQLNYPEIPEIQYSYADSGSWEINDGYLISTTSEVKLVNISHPELDKVLNLEDMFPQNISESSQILKLTKTELSLKDESDGEIYNCSKKVTKG